MPVPLEFNPDRWAQSAVHSLFLRGPGQDFRIEVIICLFLGNLDFNRYSIVCAVVYLDRSEVALSATARRLGISRLLLDFEVPSPRVAAWD